MSNIGATIVPILKQHSISRAALGKKVDLVSSRAIDDKLKPYIQKDLIEIYAEK